MSAAKKHRIVIEVNPSQLFDAARMVGSMDAIGFRLSDPFMVGTMPSFADAMGLAFYGITVVNVSSADDADLSAEGARTLAAASLPTIADPVKEGGR